MKTFIKRLFFSIPSKVQRYSLCSLAVVIVLAVMADRAISRGMNVSLAVARFVTFSATTPVAGDAMPQSQAPADTLKDSP